jgi:pantoate--beta-alanine ligase
MPILPSRPKLVTTVAQLREELNAVRRAGKKIGLVPTMGALHEGHLSLVRAAGAECDCTVVSIYVNPSQFDPGEDLAIYPRTLEADLALLAGCDTDLVFAPDDEEVYRPGHATWVEVGSVPNRWKGPVGRDISAAWPPSYSSCSTWSNPTRPTLDRRIFSRRW